MPEKTGKHLTISVEDVRLAIRIDNFSNKVQSAIDSFDEDIDKISAQAKIRNPENHS